MLKRLFLLAGLLASPAALGQTYPDRNVTIVVTSAAGALTDTLTRAVAHRRVGAGESRRDEDDGGALSWRSPRAERRDCRTHQRSDHGPFRGAELGRGRKAQDARLRQRAAGAAVPRRADHRRDRSWIR